MSFETQDYPDVVAACGAMAVTSAIADLCTRAACRIRDPASARRWLPLNPAGQVDSLVRYCSNLGVRAIQLDCSKDPLDCL